MEIRIKLQDNGDMERAIKRFDAARTEMCAAITQLERACLNLGIRFEEAANVASADGVQIQELKELTAPLVEWIRENHGYHTEVHISADHVYVKHDGIGIPYPISEE